jgi:FtsP/CotA-like multicopper oxidase with cupredoxin domain
MSHRQVRDGLYGALVVHPADRDPSAGQDLLAVVHTYDGQPTLSGRAGASAESVAAGTAVRLRVVNTDGGPVSVTVAGAAYSVVAVDGRDVVRPLPLQDRSVQVAGGGRVDLRFTVPSGSAVRVRLGVLDLIAGPEGAPVPQPAEPAPPPLDLLTYGTPARLPFDPAAPDKTFTYDIGRRPGFVDGRPGLFWTINGRTFPDVPMFVVDEGDVVRMTIRNRSGQLHPMHLHGHHLVVLARNGVAASGSPWQVDSLDVADGDTYEVAFRADNPGVWADHCHNLPHAVQGLIAHVMYRGVTTPFLIGGPAHNHPE